jgi:anti-sigma factor RsiW
MVCSEWQSKIDPYVDSELSAEEAAAFGTHVAGCATCAASALSRMKVKRAVQFAARAHHPSAEFRLKMRERINGRRSSRKSWLAFGLAAATIAVVVALGVQIAFTRAQSRQVVSEIADLHVSNLASSNPVEVVSSDRHTVKPWFQGKVPFTFDLPELAGTDFTLEGGRLVFVEREPAALLLFKYRSHHLSVFVLSDRPPFSRLGDSTRQQAAFTVQSWHEGGLRYVLITDTESAQAQRLTDLLQSTGRK